MSASLSRSETQRIIHSLSPAGIERPPALRSFVSASGRYYYNKVEPLDLGVEFPAVFDQWFGQSCIYM